MSFRTRVAVGLALASAGAAHAQTTNDAPSIAALLQRIEAQEARIKTLERKLEIKEAAVEAESSAPPLVSVTPTRTSISSADGANSIRFRGVLHFDGRRYIDHVTPETADTWLLRRARPTLEGTYNGIYDFRFAPDFGGGKTVILDAYVAARLRPWAVVQAGKFKVPVGLERLQSSTDLRFIERAFPTSLVPNRDLGLQFSGDAAEGAFQYSVGYFNGVTDGGSSDGNTPTPDAENDSKGDWAARLFFRPVQGLGLGVAVTWVDSTGDTTTTLLPTYRTPGQQSFFSYRSNTATGEQEALNRRAAAKGRSGSTPNDAVFADGERLRVSPQAYWYVGRFGFLGEYVTVRQDVSRVLDTMLTRSDTLEIRAWHAQLSWLLTGEAESFSGVTPRTTFELGKPGWGAFELVARYHVLDIDNDAFAGGANSFANPATAASRANAYGMGMNWYLNQNIKLSLSYDRTGFEGGAAGGDRPVEEVLLTRFALSF
jgi:phosphate-selective porin OprO and OprP